MRDRLARATVECLTELGYERTTTLKIVARAGVTRGALLHHFESKRAIVVFAMHRLLAEQTRRIQALAKRVRSGEVSLDEFIDSIWGEFSGEFFFAWLENITESRHDSKLREQFIPLVREYHRALDAIWREFFRKSHLSSIQVETYLNQTLCLLRGMALQTVLRRDPPYYHELLRGWKAVLKREIVAKRAAR